MNAGIQGGHQKMVSIPRAEVIGVYELPEVCAGN